MGTHLTERGIEDGVLVVEEYDDSELPVIAAMVPISTVTAVMGPRKIHPCRVRRPSN